MVYGFTLAHGKTICNMNSEQLKKYSSWRPLEAQVSSLRS